MVLATMAFGEREHVFATMVIWETTAPSTGPHTNMGLCVQMAWRVGPVAHAVQLVATKSVFATMGIRVRRAIGATAVSIKMAPMRVSIHAIPPLLSQSPRDSGAPSTNVNVAQVSTLLAPPLAMAKGCAATPTVHATALWDSQALIAPNARRTTLVKRVRRVQIVGRMDCARLARWDLESACAKLAIPAPCAQSVHMVMPPMVVLVDPAHCTMGHRAIFQTVCALQQVARPLVAADPTILAQRAVELIHRTRVVACVPKVRVHVESVIATRDLAGRFATFPQRQCAQRIQIVGVANIAVSSQGPVWRVGDVVATGSS